jgi:histidine ammonia-lyase
MKRLRTLKEFLASAEALTLPPLLSRGTDPVSASYRDLLSFLAENPDRAVYGISTYPGHRDARRSSGDRDFQEALLDGHAISVEEPYEAFEARCIGYAKAYAIAAGGTPISPALYDGICRAITDPRFAPEVPRFSSYSCGDVIPASHWAQALLRHLDPPHALGPGEAMGLINGAFVHVGVASALARRLKRFWGLFIATSQAGASLCAANPRNFNLAAGAENAIGAEMTRYVAHGLAKRQSDVPQDAVSIRALPQVLDALAKAIEFSCAELDRLLRLPSGNPMLLPDPDSGRSEPHPQGSFMSPALTIATSAVIDALLLCGWCSVSRTKYLLSGRARAVPQDGIVKGAGIGFIQWPKLMQATLEDARMVASRRPFASGGATSMGIEDLWSFGTLTNESLRSVLERLERLLCLELTLCELLSRRFRKGSSILPPGLHIDWRSKTRMTRDDVAAILERFSRDEGIVPLQRFPI